VYHVIFSNGKGGQAQPLILSTISLGQTAYCTGLYLDTDYQKQFPFLNWKNTTAPADYEIGDVNGDSMISVLDATVIQRDVAKTSILDDEQKSRADLDGDSLITVLDATEIQRKVAKLN
ncbi:MAG: dockerin type I repeat-containing protein, partial [Eubacteriales bacterium]|nr:dockerin type I repeat-containing protein [Eubacteriales bacterium]